MCRVNRKAQIISHMISLKKDKNWRFKLGKIIHLQTKIQIEIKKERRKADKQKDRQRDRQPTDRQTDRHFNRQTDTRNTNKHILGILTN